MRTPGLRTTLFLALAVSGVSAAAVLATNGEKRRHSAAATLYVAPSGSDSGLCTRARPCASFNGAYRVASPGATVIVAAGSYADQLISYDSSKSGEHCNAYDMPADVSGCVTFQPDAGATISFGGNIVIVGNGVRLKGFDMGVNGIDINPGGVCHLPRTNGVILDHLRSNGGKVSIDAAQYVADLHGNWANGSGESLIAHSCNAGSQDNPEWIEPTHLRLDHSWYHDVVQHTTGTSEHIECIHLDATDYVTIEASRFTNCAGYDIRIAYEHRTVENVSHYLIENSFFAATCSQQQVGFNCFPIAELEFDGSCLPGTSCESNVIRFNTIDGHFFPSVEDSSKGLFTNSAFYGNVVAGGEDAFHCRSKLAAGMAYYDNVWGTKGQNDIAVPCGTKAVNADGQLVAAGAPSYDFRLASRTARAAGFVPADVRGGFPAVDFAGQPRPTRASLDAGAYQWETALMVLGRSIGALRLSEGEAEVVSTYGRPRRRRRVSIGKAKLDLLSYRVHGGSLSAYLDAGKVVGIGTTSPYYTSPGGIGVGTDAGPVRTTAGTIWVECRRALRRKLGGVGLYVGVFGGKGGKRISGVTMIRTAYPYEDC